MFKKIYQILSFGYIYFGPLETVVCMAILKIFSHFEHKQAAMQTHKKTNKNSRSQQIRTVDMQAEQTQTQPNTS